MILSEVLEFGGQSDPNVNLSTIHAEASIEIKALAQEHRLQILKTLDAKVAPDAMVSEL